jgi:preprotein translocase subunit SecG
MQNVILVVHILACVVMTGLVLIQKSEGGGLGMGGGGGGNSLMSGRGAAGALVRTTIILGGVFFIQGAGRSVRSVGPAA